MNDDAKKLKPTTVLNGDIPAVKDRAFRRAVIANEQRPVGQASANPRDSVEERTVVQPTGEKHCGANGSRYSYYKSSNASSRITRRDIEHAIRLGYERCNPSLANPDFLVYRERRRLFSDWLRNLPGRQLDVVDIGGRIQPHRPLVEDRIGRYVAIDPQLTGLVDAVAVGEQLPLPDNTFDLVFCTQVLGYATDPSRVIAEIHRVLKPGGVLFLSVSAFFPAHHDEHWRFLPQGLQLLLDRFPDVEIAPEGYSVSGLFRTINACLNIFIRIRLLRALVGVSLIPLMNLAGLWCDRFSFGNTQFTTNYSVFARK